MKLPEDVRQFRDLSLLHDNALSPAQRQQLQQGISQEMLFSHQIFVRKLLGSAYQTAMPAQNRAKMTLLRWLSP